MRKGLLLGLCLLTGFWLSAETLTLGSWNVEHLGSPGRGLGYRDLPLRSNRQLRDIAEFIKDQRIDALALQEVAITGFDGSLPLSEPLEKICSTLGPHWSYRVLGDWENPPSAGSIHNMQNAFIWNEEKLHLLNSFPLQVQSVAVGRKNTFDRIPYAAWFESTGGNDFLLVNLHLTSGQDNDENHLAAMVMVERNIGKTLKDLDITESDRIILGDFNDNPWAKDTRGNRAYLNLLYLYMEEKGFRDLMTKEFPFSRFNNNLDSRIDHVLINRSALRHFQEESFRIPYPSSELRELQRWRETFSDHLPLLFELKIGRDDDSD